MAGQAAPGRRTNVRYILSERLELVHGEGIVKTELLLLAVKVED